MSRKIQIASKFRDSDLQLCLFDGCIFADFALDKQSTKNQVLSLSRISFDGFGCCNTTGKGCAMTEGETKAFQELIKDGNDALGNEETQARALAILSKFFSKYQNVIWSDALERYNLLLSR